MILIATANTTCETGHSLIIWLRLMTQVKSEKFTSIGGNEMRLINSNIIRVSSSGNGLFPGVLQFSCGGVDGCWIGATVVV